MEEKAMGEVDPKNADIEEIDLMMADSKHKINKVSN